MITDIFMKSLPSVEFERLGTMLGAQNLWILLWVTLLTMMTSSMSSGSVKLVYDVNGDEDNVDMYCFEIF